MGLAVTYSFTTGPVAGLEVGVGFESQAGAEDYERRAWKFTLGYKF